MTLALLRRFSALFKTCLCCPLNFAHTQRKYIQDINQTVAIILIAAVIIYWHCKTGNIINFPAFLCYPEEYIILGEDKYFFVLEVLIFFSVLDTRRNWMEGGCGNKT